MIMVLRIGQRRLATLAVIAGMAAMSGCAILDTAGPNDDFSNRVYAGISGLASQVEPDTDAVLGTSVDESMSAGASLTLGYDITDRFSVEGHLADLGEATLDPAGSVGYRVGGVSAVVYGLNEELDRSRRTGFAVFGKLGLGMMSNDAEIVDYRRVNDVHLLVGLGLEYGLQNGLGFRAEIVAHETDAKFAQLGVVYRFKRSDQHSGSAISGEAESIAEETQAAVVATDDVLPDDSLIDDRQSAKELIEDSTGTESADTPVDTLADATDDSSVETPAASDESTAELSTPSVPAAVISDSDADGVLDPTDQCPNTDSGAPVKSDGCAVFAGVIEGITFEPGSDTLTAGATQVLDGIVATLTEYPDVRVSVEAHTDNLGSAAANLLLSKRRAIAVARYLVDNGVSGSRLKPQAFGESQPRASNLTSEGRAANRRVEFSLQ